MIFMPFVLISGSSTDVTVCLTVLGYQKWISLNPLDSLLLLGWLHWDTQAVLSVTGRGTWDLIGTTLATVCCPCTHIYSNYLPNLHVCLHFYDPNTVFTSSNQGYVLGSLCHSCHARWCPHLSPICAGPQDSNLSARYTDKHGMPWIWLRSLDIPAVETSLLKWPFWLVQWCVAFGYEKIHRGRFFG